jgi:hypothetical protein
MQHTHGKNRDSSGPGSAGDYCYFNGKRETGNRKWIGSGVDIETDCDTDTDRDNAVRAASSGSHIKTPDSAGGILLLPHGKIRTWQHLLACFYRKQARRIIFGDEYIYETNCFRKNRY